MYTRIAKCNINPGKNSEVTRVLNNEILPELASQPGFVDAVELYGDNEPGTLVSITFWKTKEQAQQYHRDVFPRFAQKLESVTSNWTVTGYNVETSSMHRIAAGKAA